MDELPPKAAALLTAARRDHDPSRSDSERVRFLLATAIAAPPAAQADTCGADKSTLGTSKAGGLLSSAFAKGLLVLGLLAGAALGIHGLRSARPASHSEPAREPAPLAAAVAEPAIVASRTIASAESAVPGTPHSGEQPAAEDRNSALPLTPPSVRGSNASPHTEARLSARAPSLPPRMRVGASKSAPTRTMPHEATATATSDQAAEAQVTHSELALMRDALSRLKLGDAREALALLGVHAARYPNGIMSEERDGLRAIALCRTGDLTQGVAAQQSFLRVYPSSTMAGRVQRACAEGAR